ncbi:MAG: thermonuclease family protein [Dermatophilaceae bacterium]
MTRVSPGRLVGVVVAVLLAVVLYRALGVGAAEPSAAPAPAATATATSTATATDTEAAAATISPATEESASASSPGAGGGVVVPVVGIVDGDTLRVRVDGVTERLRVIGLDAPELSDGECLAQEAASRMQSLVQSRDVRIVADPTQDDRDVYDRLLRHVWTLDGRSVARELIAEGLAREYTYAAPYDGVADHRTAEAEAVAAGRGIWGPACSAPAPAVPPVPLAPTGQCDIKGNINAEGERIYHLPGQRYYDDTRISEERGERWFCSEDEARRAGWRAAKV